ncbi:hypothetical protein Tco_0753318 [Tanacetum coccineum]
MVVKPTVGCDLNQKKEKNNGHVLRTKMMYEVSCIAVIFPLSEDHLNYLKQCHIIGIRALSYRELGCISDMSNSDELRHADNTTLVPPRLPDTLSQVYHRRRPTLGLLVLSSVLLFSPTIKRTARISILPIEPNLAEHARISAINLDDYQLDPLTPPPSPSSPFSMAAYHQNSVPVLETALTVCTTRLRGQLHTILEDMERYPNACSEELEAFMTLQMCEDAEDRANNAQEKARQKRKEALEEVVQ